MQKEDYDKLTYMSIQDAVDIIKDRRLLIERVGNLIPDSEFRMDYDKARLYMALEKIIAYLDYTGKSGVDLSEIVMETMPLEQMAPISHLDDVREIPPTMEEVDSFLHNYASYEYTGNTMCQQTSRVKSLTQNSVDPSRMCEGEVDDFDEFEIENGEPVADTQNKHVEAPRHSLSGIFSGKLFSR